MKPKKTVIFFLFFSVLFSLLAFPVHADIGPKPSVHIIITGLEDESYYVTLLSKTSSTGPASAYDGTYAAYEEGEDGYEIWKTFVDYRDADGFYFLQQFRQCKGNTEYVWGYYPPHTFKVLFYFPETDRFFVTNIHERYAFDSYFKVDLSDLQSAGTFIPAQKNYDYTWETLSLITRILLTVCLEIALAWFFRYRTKKTLVFILCVNTVTQIILNVILNAVNFALGQWAFIAYYIFLEIIVFALEAVAYAIFFPKFSPNEKRVKAVLYALAANVFSFAVGLGIAHLIPGIF